MWFLTNKPSSYPHCHINLLLIAGLFETDAIRIPETQCDYKFESLSTSASGSGSNRSTQLNLASQRTTRGRFYSPQYPSTYPKSIECTYFFVGQSNERVKLIFENIRLQKSDLRWVFCCTCNKIAHGCLETWSLLAVRSDSSDILWQAVLHFCVYLQIAVIYSTLSLSCVSRANVLFLSTLSCLNSPDVILVHDGRDKSSPVIGQLCNTKTFVELVSTSQFLFIEFLSRSHFPGQGFKGRFYFETVTPPSLTSSSSSSSSSSFPSGLPDVPSMGKWNVQPSWVVRHERQFDLPLLLGAVLLYRVQQCK